MYAEIKLTTSDGDERTVPMLATASTPIRYKMLYGKDLMTSIIDQNGDFDLDVISKVAYLMANQAAKVDMRTLDQDKYLEWLDTWDSMTFIDKSQEIFEIYLRSAENSSKAKKQGARLQGK